MTVKVFLQVIKRGYYRGNPPTAFEIELGYSVCLSSGLMPFDDPHTEEGAMLMQFPLDTTPAAVYQKAWEMIQETCLGNGWEVPKKSDVYAWIPLTLADLLP